jgi:hypothetical protein
MRPSRSIYTHSPPQEFWLALGIYAKAFEATRKLKYAFMASRRLQGHGMLRSPFMASRRLQGHGMPRWTPTCCHRTLYVVNQI